MIPLDVLLLVLEMILPLLLSLVLGCLPRLLLSLFGLGVVAAPPTPGPGPGLSQGHASLPRPLVTCPDLFLQRVNLLVLVRLLKLSLHLGHNLRPIFNQKLIVPLGPGKTWKIGKESGKINSYFLQFFSIFKGTLTRKVTPQNMQTELLIVHRKCTAIQGFIKVQF